MDSDFWASRLAAAKRQFHHQHHQLHATSHLGSDLSSFEYQIAKMDVLMFFISSNCDTDGLNWGALDVEDEVRSDIPCPYCYEDFDLGSLCIHLEYEHSSESGPTVCPICVVKVSRDILNHITLQHGHAFKIQRRRRLRNLLGRDSHLHNLGGGGAGLPSNSTNSINDPFLSSLVLNLPPDHISTSDVSLNNTIQEQPSKSSYDPCLSKEERERMIKQATMRAGFVQDLFFSTFLED